jgi:hypothetical protein
VSLVFTIYNVQVQYTIIHSLLLAWIPLILELIEEYGGKGKNIVQESASKTEGTPTGSSMCSSKA